MQKCTRCNKPTPCGCSDTPLTTYAPSTACATPQVCSEFIYTGCMIYNGPEIQDFCITPGMNFNDVIQALVLYQSSPSCVSGICPIHAPYLSVGTVNGTTIQIKWEGMDDILYYTLNYGDEDGSPFAWTSVVIAPSATDYTITGLVCATTYLINVSVTYGSDPDTCQSVTIKVTTADC